MNLRQESIKATFPKDKVYKNAFEKYTINQSKLLRYATRRQKKIEIDELIKSINRPICQNSSRSEKTKWNIIKMRLT